MTEEFFRAMAELDRIFAVGFMIATVVFAALELEDYFKRKNGDLTRL